MAEGGNTGRKLIPAEEYKEETQERLGDKTTVLGWEEKAKLVWRLIEMHETIMQQHEKLMEILMEEIKKF